MAGLKRRDFLDIAAGAAVSAFLPGCNTNSQLKSSAHNCTSAGDFNITYKKADSHIHLFEHGYPRGFSARSGITVQDIKAYESLSQTYQVTDALIVGYEGEDFAKGNNDYIASLSSTIFRMHRLAFIKNDSVLDIAALDTLHQKHFEGIVFYIFDDNAAANLNRIDSSTWNWLIENRWLISVNSKGALWKNWIPILQRYSEIKLLISHLGLPPAMEKADHDKAQVQLADVLNLSKYPSVFVKLSGFYAMTLPSFDYPHEAAWPYVQSLLEKFGSNRLVWGSDFAPYLEQVSFPQTFGLFSKMPFLSDDDSKKILYDNLMNILTV
jgi:L-fuconolactonase